MVRSVSEDKLYDTIEFNEFLQMMSKQQEDDIYMNAMVEALWLDCDTRAKVSWIGFTYHTRFFLSRLLETWLLVCGVSI